MTKEERNEMCSTFKEILEERSSDESSMMNIHYNKIELDVKIQTDIAYQLTRIADQLEKFKDKSFHCYIKDETARL